MRNSPLILAGAILALAAADLATLPVAQASGFDFMNPSQWFGGNHRRYDDDYYYDRYRYGYGPGWGGGYGPGWGGYGPGWGGYGPYGYGYPGYGYPAQQNQEKVPERLPQ